MISVFKKFVANSILFGVACILIATLGLSLKAILIKLVYQTAPDIDAITILTLRFLIALPFFLVLPKLIASKNSHSENNGITILKILALGAVGFYLSAILDFSSLAYISAGLERLILFLYPTFVIIISFFIQPKEVTGKILWALSLSYLGIALVFIEQASSLDAVALKGVLLVFSAAIIFAFYTVGSVSLIRRTGSVKYTMIAMGAATFATLIHYLSEHEIKMLLLQSTDVYILVSLMAVFSTFIPLVLMAEGIKRIGASSASVVTTVGPVITLGLAYLFLDEVLGFFQMLGAILIIVGVFVASKK